MVGTLDKYALLTHLSMLTSKEKVTWEGIIRMLDREKEVKRWRELDLSTGRDVDYHWRSQEWAPREEPNWNSVQFQTFLRLWEAGYRRIGKRDIDEWWDGNIKIRYVASPIFEAMKPVVLEAEEFRRIQPGDGAQLRPLLG